MGQGATQLIDVTEVVRRLGAEGKLEGDLKVTLFPRVMTTRRRPRIAAAAPKVATPRKVSVGAIRLLGSGE
jgi:hypothetical protein